MGNRGWGSIIESVAAHDPFRMHGFQVFRDASHGRPREAKPDELGMSRVSPRPAPEDGLGQ